MLKKVAIYWGSVPVLMVLLALLPLTAASAQSTTQVVERAGNIDSGPENGDGLIVGWLTNPNSLSRSSYFYLENETYNQFTGQWERFVTHGGITKVIRQDVNSAWGLTGKHGFSVAATSSYYGHLNKIHLYGWDDVLGEWYEVNQSNPKVSIVREKNDNRPSVSGWVKTLQGELLDSFNGGYVQVTLLRMNEEGGWLSYESWQNDSTGNCYVQQGRFSCWEGTDWENGNRLNPGEYRIEIQAEGMQIFSKSFRYYGNSLELGDLVLEPFAGMSIVRSSFNGRHLRVTVEVDSDQQNRKGQPLEVCGTVRGRGVNTYDVFVPFGCQPWKKGKKQSYEFQMEIPKEFPAGFWVSYKFTLGESGNPWQFSGEVWGYTLIRRR